MLPGGILYHGRQGTCSCGALEQIGKTLFPSLGNSYLWALPLEGSLSHGKDMAGALGALPIPLTTRLFVNISIIHDGALTGLPG